MKYNDNGTYKDIYVKTFDTLPVGTEVDYDGNTVPSGWTETTPIIESGSNENGNYIKFNDGTMICTKSITGTLGGIAWGNVYYSDHAIGSWAETFTTIYNVVASIDANQYWCNVAGGGFNSVRVFRPNSGTTTGTIRLFAIGKWV